MNVHNTLAQCDLEYYFTSLAHRIPTDHWGKSFIFAADTFPQLPTTIATPRLYMRRTYHAYNDYRVDSLWIYASKHTYRTFALCILAAVFQSHLPRVEMRLTHPFSDIKQVLIDRYMPYSRTIIPMGLVVMPFTFQYHPSDAAYHPWAKNDYDIRDLPRFSLTNAHHMIINDDEYRNRDTLVGFGSLHGAVRLAELLLDVSRPESTLTECALESEGGFRGVGIHSAEAQFFLPGHVGWDARAWPDDTVD